MPLLAWLLLTPLALADVPPDPPSDPPSSKCGCTAVTPAAAGGWSLLALGLLAARRRS